MINPLDYEDDVKETVDEIINSLEEILEEDVEEEMKTNARGMIHCYSNYYTLEEMASYMISNTKMDLMNVTVGYVNFIKANPLGGFAYMVYSEYQKQQREATRTEASGSSHKATESKEVIRKKKQLRHAQGMTNPLDFEASARKLVKGIITGLAGVIKDDKEGKEAKTNAHALMHCYIHYFSFTEMVDYVTSETNLPLSKVTNSFFHDILENPDDGKAYIVYSEYRAGQREAARKQDIEQQKLDKVINELQELHVCGPDCTCNTSTSTSASTSASEQLIVKNGIPT